MKKLNALIATACIMGSVSLNSATTLVKAAPRQDNKPAATQGAKPDAESERKAYAAYKECEAEKDFAKKLTMAKTGISTYPNSQYLPYFKQQLDLARANVVNNDIKDSKLADAFKLSEEILAENKDNLYYLYILADAATNVAKKSPPDFTYAEKGNDYAKRSIELIKAGKVPQFFKPEDWEKRKTRALASMYQSVGLFAINAKKEDDALAAFKDSLAQDCSDPITYFLMARIHSGKYDALSKEYEGLPDDKKSGDEGKALLDKINGVVDTILETDASLLAVSDGNKQFDTLRGRVRPAIEEFYKFRHEGKLDGIEAFLDGFKSKCTTKP